jgi:Bacterial membrane protein YfhO
MRRTGWREVWLRRRADLGALAFIGCFFLVFFSWLVWERKFSIGSDAFGYSFPLRTTAWQMIRHGALPLWTPHIMSGYPLLAMGQLALGYPLTWGYLFLPNTWAEEIYLLAPYLLAPAFTYAYCRELGRTRLASLLAGLAFAYGGIMIGVLGLYGFMSNSIIWLPLMLLAIERARRPRSFVPCLLGATGAYVLSLLNGYPQGFVYTATLAGAYACFNSIALPPDDAASARDNSVRLWSWQRWRPLAVALGAQVLALGLAAFQLLETLRAVRRSARVNLEQELFRSGSPQLLNYELGSLLAPLYYWEIPTYVAPLALVLATFALSLVVRRGRRDLRVIFWFVVAVITWLLLSANTPLYQLFNHVPIFRSFQVPMRHSFEWTFAIGVLAAYGWDAWRTYARTNSIAVSAQRRQTIITATLFGLSLILAALWWRSATHAPLPGANTPLATLLKSSYMLWKICFTLLTLAVLWQGQKIVAARTRHALLLACLALSCFVEAHISVYQWWRQFAKPAVRYQTPGAATKFLQQFPPAANRVYTRVNLFAEEFPTAPRLDPPNVTALYGLHNVAGAEPLILERYSRALGGVLADTVSQRHGAQSNIALITDPRSHVLDLLNTNFVVSYAGLATAPQHLLVKDGIEFNEQLNTELSPSDTIKLSGTGGTCDTLAFVTVLSHAVEMPQGAPVARVLVRTTDGRTFEFALRAGVDTAEWAHERTDVRPFIKHTLAPIYNEYAGDAAHSFTAYRYLARVSLGAAAQVERVEIKNVTTSATLDLAAVTLFDSAGRTSTPLLPIDPDRWQAVYHRDDVLILRNARALPRAWLVAEAEAIDGDEALRRISGDETAGAFDPHRTALLEVKPAELPALQDGALANASAQVVYQPNRIEIETLADASALLVVSEMSYPGWVATIDGKSAPIYTTDFILQSVPVPAGRHNVVLRYTAPAARMGALIGLCALFIMCALFVAHRRTNSK